MSEEQIIDFLTENIDYFVTNDFVVAIIRTIGWMLVKGVNQLIEGSKTIYNAAFGLIDITRYTGVQEFINEYEPLLQALLVVSLVVLGYIYILGKEKRHDLLTSLLIFAVVVTSSTYLFSTFNNFTIMFKDAVISGGSNTDGKELIRQNLYDLRYIDEQIGLANLDSSGEIPQYPNLTEKDMRMINIAETLPDDEEGLTEEAKDILSKRLRYVKGGSFLEDVYNGVAMTSFGNTYYFRYQFHYGTYFLNAFALILLYFGLGYVNVKIIVELLRSRVLVVLFSADLSSKKKAVRILESIRDGYYALCFTAIELRLYLILTDYINSKTALSPLVRGILLVFVAFTMIEGSSIAEKITGVDAGITATTHRLMGAAHAVRGAAQMAMQAKQLSSLNKMSKGNGGSDANRGTMESGYTSDSEHGTDGMPGNHQNETSQNNHTETDSQNATHDSNGNETGDHGTETMNEMENSGADKSTSGMERMSESAADTNLESENTSAADQHFNQMDQAIGSDGERSSEYGNVNRESPGMTSDYDKKGMFERRSGQAKSQAGSAEKYGESGGSRAERKTGGSGTVSRKSMNRADTFRQKFDSKKEKD